MRSETLEELKAIIENAPEGATHLDDDGDYVKFIDDEMYHYSFVRGYGWSSDYVSPCELRSLSDIKRIIELMEATQGLLQIFSGVDDGYCRNELKAARKALGYEV
ncbi:MAG: hypothetical protein COB48_13085 [Pseudoalteromonas sp.]|nr:MAG: hypothetical protein COB48_13085 [Pseudoalteromonas sp.]